MVKDTRSHDPQGMLSLHNQQPNSPPQAPDFSFLRPLRPTVVFATYWRFAVERQRIFLRRIRGDPPPWTNDSILLEHKFTNAYRAADRVSQYLIRNVVYCGVQTSREIFFRTILFKLFNRIETWSLLSSRLGEIQLADFSFELYDEILSAAFAAGQRLYSAAYIMPSGGGESGFTRKHQMHLQLLKRMIDDELPERITDSASMKSAFSLLRSYPSIGDFLAYQYVTDLNYSTLTDFSEMEFVVPGPGAKDGIRKCFYSLGGLTEPEVIKFITDRQQECFAAVGVRFPTLWGRRLQLIDCQNLFCEVGKYARMAHPEFSGESGRTRIKQKLRPSISPFDLWFPPKWGINERLSSSPQYVPDS
jgi:hypothetical protein